MTPIDQFILARLESAGLTPAAPVDKTALIRRLTFDLTGLPPTLEEQESFLKDERPDAYERLVERFLASPHYGERWAQHWLDVVRYAESNGYEADGDRPNAWRFRDYVVRSFNEDKPFDRFLTEQLAGDELAAGKDSRAAADLWVAAGLHRCGPVHLTSGNVDTGVIRQEVLTEMVQGIGSAFLGLTMNCARCHDHKFDPISQGDYYRLEAFFAATQPREVDFATPAEREGHQKQVQSLTAQINPIKSQVATLDEPVRRRLAEQKRAALEPAYQEALAADPKKRTPRQQQLAKDAEVLIKVTWDEVLAAMSPADRRQREELRARQHALEAELPTAPSQAWTVSNEATPPPTYVLKRGELKRKVATVGPGYPRVLRTDDRGQKSGVAGQPAGARLGRVDLARWLTSAENPLTARVFVNRLWQHHFGRGIVGTPNDFGLRGQRPTHPELLDWLAVEFRESGWDVKHAHRLLVLSNTYRMASKVVPGEQARTVDPDNRLLWRMNRRRLEGESIRDCMLAAAGTLNRQLGGPMVRVPLEPEVYDLIFTEGERDGLWPVTPDVRQHSRRSLYLLAKRNVRLPMMEAFDQPDRLTPCAVRAVSTFAPQALILMNGPAARASSREMAARLLADAGNRLDRAVELAYRRAYARPPSETERRLARSFFEEQSATIRQRLQENRPVAVPDHLPADADPAAAAALADYCLAIFNANEFVYVP